jgi:epsilon-lactone hydrolase
MIAVPPLGEWVSPAARERFATSVWGAAAPDGTMAEVRAHYDAVNRARVEVALREFAVAIEDATLGGVPVAVVTPDDGVADDATLLCLHGGAFMWGAGAGALIEAIPIAATTRRRVIAVDYRLAPEHVWPAANDDVAACYAALLDERPAAAIGVYGCSAGGLLTAQLVARLLLEGRPPPGATAMLHAAGLEVGGDSVALAGWLNGVPQSAVVERLADLPFLAATDPADPLVFPGDHPELLAGFPPSLLITGTRDFAAGSVATMHRRLVAAGATAALAMFDGMWHAHHVDTDLPEARETFAIMARFFARHLASG